MKSKNLLLGNLLFLSIGLMPCSITGQSFTVNNPFGVVYDIQPVEYLLNVPVQEDNVSVLDEDGNIVGQISRDKKRAFLSIGFESGEASRSLTIKSVADPAAGIAYPVTISHKPWTSAEAAAVSTAFPNGIASYYEITNGLCGIRVPMSVQHKDGEWAGQPDFRSFVVPARNAYAREYTSEDWRFNSFSSEIIEEGPIRTTVRVTIGTTDRDEPYFFEMTLFAGEQFIKFYQGNGRINDWFLDLNLFKPTPWRPMRWRSGANHHWYGDGAGQERDVELKDRPGTMFNLKWDMRVRVTSSAMTSGWNSCLIHGAGPI
jgi:hypothetical protein